MREKSRIKLMKSKVHNGLFMNLQKHWSTLRDEPLPMYTVDEKYLKDVEEE